MVFVVEFAPSFCCVPDPPRRNVVFACGYVAPFVSLKSSNFVFLLNFVVFALFFCFVFLFFFRFFLFSFFSVFAFLCFRFFRNSFCSNVTSLFFGRPLLFRLFFRFLSCDSIFVFCFVLFCFPLFRDNGILLGGPEPPTTRRTDGSAPYAITGSYLDDASLVKFGPAGSLFFSFARDPFSIALAGKAESW